MPGMPGERRPGLKRDTGEGRLGRYFTNIGPAKGPISYRDSGLRGPIGVLQARDDHGPPSPYLCGGHDDAANIAGRT